VANYGDRNGEFGSVAVQVADDCDTLKSVTTDYGSASLSAVIDVERDTSQPGCEAQGGGSGLSTGAIVGIAFGAAVAVGVAIALVVYFVRKRQISETERIFMKNMTDRESSKFE